MSSGANDRRPRQNTRGTRKGPANSLQVYLARHAQVFFYSLGRLVKTPFATFMTAAVIGIALALPSGLHVILNNVQQLSDGWGGATQISVFLRNGTKQDTARGLVTKLSRMPEIDEVHYISPDAALEEFKRFSGFGDALKALDENPLPGVVV
ncbi:MAG: cell division protein, partial [Pseudomonadota bacterium]